MKTLFVFGRLLLGGGCLFAIIGALGQNLPPVATERQSSQRLQLTLKAALVRAKANSTQFQAAATNLQLALEGRTQARSTSLPSVSYNNSVINTQSIGLQNQIQNPNSSPVVFIANNAVHEYISQINVHESLSLEAVAKFRSASAAAAVARAQVEIASRGLVTTVVSAYYSVEAAQAKLETAKESAAQGEDFFKITQALERGGESAHSDVIKAELQVLDRKRQLQEAEMAFLNARLDLAVLIFPDFSDNFDLMDDLHATAPLAPLNDIQQLAMPDNPGVAASRAAVQLTNYDLLAARAEYLPSLSFDYFYGIDATHFAANSIVNGEKVPNLGYSVLGAVNLPIWNWGSTQSRVNQAELRNSQAKRELSKAERKLLADIQSRYAEADVAMNELRELHSSAELARESLRLAVLRYQNGEARVLEVVDAQNSFFSANSNYQDGAVRYHVALAELQTLTGILNNP